MRTWPRGQGCAIGFKKSLLILCGWMSMHAFAVLLQIKQMEGFIKISSIPPSSLVQVILANVFTSSQAKRERTNAVIPFLSRVSSLCGGNRSRKSAEYLSIWLNPEIFANNDVPQVHSMVLLPSFALRRYQCWHLDILATAIFSR